MKSWISFPRIEGTASRQAHADLPSGTYEREMGKEGFFGPATQFYHIHPPTGWTSWEGPLRPRAFDLTRINSIAASPWEADAVLSNAHLRFRQWRTEGRMDRLVRNGDGDELIFVHEGSGSLFCDFGHLRFRAGDYIVLPRGTMWRIECDGPVTALLIEATNDSRSEEHTSELQSRGHLVCRLLLEKKKTKQTPSTLLSPTTSQPTTSTD